MLPIYPLILISKVLMVSRHAKKLFSRIRLNVNTFSVVDTLQSQHHIEKWLHVTLSLFALWSSVDLDITRIIKGGSLFRFSA